MNYIFFDIECADGGIGSICSLGYVITDENFREIVSRDITMNPPGDFHLEGRVGRPDVPLWYPKEVFRASPKFYHYYDEIKELLEGDDQIVIGHSVKNDADFLNKSCKRYKKDFLNFRFADTQKLYGIYASVKKQTSLENAIEALELPAQEISHRSDEDAKATMRLLKALCEKMECDFPTLMEKYPSITGETKDGIALYTGEELIEKRHDKRLGCKIRILKEGQENWLLKGSENSILFTRLLDFAEPKTEVPQVLTGRKVTVSLNYEMYHYKEMVRLVQMITDAGGQYVLKASIGDLFATFDLTDENGEVRRCSRSEYVKEAIENGANIEVMTLDSLLALLGTTREELESAEPLDIDYLKDKQYSKNKVFELV